MIKDFNNFRLNEAHVPQLDFQDTVEIVETSNVPDTWSKGTDFQISRTSVRWSLNMNTNKSGIEWFDASVSQLVLYGTFEDDEEFEIEIQNANTEFYNITNSFYATYVTVDMQDSDDQKDWNVTVYFGNP
jgi:hypothetical protein